MLEERQMDLRSWKTHEVGLKVIEHYKALVNWLTDCKLKGNQRHKD